MPIFMPGKNWPISMGGPATAGSATLEHPQALSPGVVKHRAVLTAHAQSDRATGRTLSGAERVVLQRLVGSGI